jgi:hypothetical protein
VPVFPYCYLIMLLRALHQHNDSHTQTHVTPCPQCNYMRDLKYLRISRAPKILTEDFRNYRLIFSQHTPWIYKHDFLRHTETGPPKFERSSCSANNIYSCDSFSNLLAKPDSHVQVNSQSTWLFIV